MSYVFNHKQVIAPQSLLISVVAHVTECTGQINCLHRGYSSASNAMPMTCWIVKLEEVLFCRYNIYA